MIAARTTASLGAWLLGKWQARLKETNGDFLTVARQMRKQGYPLEVTLRVLTGREWHQ